MTNDALIDVFVMGLNSAEITIVEFQLRSVGDMGDQLAIRLRSMRSSNDLCALRTDCHGSVCKGVHRRRSWRSWRSVRDQSDPLAFWKILALYMALSQSAALWNGGIRISKADSVPWYYNQQELSAHFFFPYSDYTWQSKTTWFKSRYAFVLLTFP